MSKYATSRTEFDDADLLVDSLEALGYPVERAAEGKRLPMNGWLDNSEAEIVIRKQFLPRAHADIGFRQRPDGTYSVLADEDDMRTYGYGDRWLTAVKVEYRQRRLIQEGTQRLGLRFVKSFTNDDGEVQLEFAKV